ncbi:MAG: formylglycine-generating enzyme family protein [bacterium]
MVLSNIKNSCRGIILSALLTIGIVPAGAKAVIEPPRAECARKCHLNFKKEYLNKIKEIYTSRECAQCHGRVEDHLLKPAGERSLTGIKPIVGTPAETSLKPTEMVIPKKQEQQLAKLKGRPFTIPGTSVVPPPGMVYIPPGNFIMGSNDRWDDESPEYVIYLGGYFIDRHEVTNAQYKAFIDKTGYNIPKTWKDGRYPADKADHPVTGVTWYDAAAYAKAMGKRLPTEEEWEKAARGVDGRTYPWGMLFDNKYSNNPQRDSKGTEPVGSSQIGNSPFGLWDVSGNVWEWVNAYYYPHPGNKIESEEYGTKYRLAKGGSWFNCLYYNCGISAPMYNRAFFLPTTNNNSLGFRCALSLDDKGEAGL